MIIAAYLMDNNILLGNFSQRHSKLSQNLCTLLHKNNPPLYFRWVYQLPLSKIFQVDNSNSHLSGFSLHLDYMFQLGMDFDDLQMYFLGKSSRLDILIQKD